jgi:cysteine desulfurase
MPGRRKIYLDHNASCPVDPRVREAMLPLLGENFANPSSIHRPGQRARAAVEEARASVARLLGCADEEVAFTSGGTEANNLALRGAVAAARLERGIERPLLVTSPTEHSCVRQTAKAMEEEGLCEVAWLPVSRREGLISLGSLREALRPGRTALVSVMLANNETGAIQDVAAMAAMAHEAGALFHTDAVQAAGKIPLDMKALGADMMSVSAHKFYGPKGAGAIAVRHGAALRAHMWGGPQEKKRRGGTENVCGIAGMGRAAELAATEFLAAAPRLAALRDSLERGILQKVEDVTIQGPSEPSRRIANTLNAAFRGCDGEALLINLDLKGIAVSTGSACSSGLTEPSPVLMALGMSRAEAKSALRFSFGMENSREDVEAVLEILPAAVEELRRLAA